MNVNRIYPALLLVLLLLSSCNSLIDFVAPGFGLMIIIGAILMFGLFLIGTVKGLFTSDENGKSNFDPEGFFIVVILGIFLLGIFGNGCN